MSNLYVTQDMVVVQQSTDAVQVSQNMAVVQQGTNAIQVSQVMVVVMVRAGEPEPDDDRRTFLSLRRRGSHPLL